MLRALIYLISLLTPSLALFTSQVRYGDWQIHTISVPSHLSVVDGSSLVVTLTPIRGDADLFVSPCGIEPSNVVRNYLGYSFTFGVERITIPLYILKEIQPSLCAYVIGKAVETCAYTLEASIVAEENAHTEHRLTVSIGTHVRGENNLESVFDDGTDGIGTDAGSGGGSGTGSPGYFGQGFSTKDEEWNIYTVLTTIFRVLLEFLG
jgi:hypothetical protein